MWQKGTKAADAVKVAHRLTLRWGQSNHESPSKRKRKAERGSERCHVKMIPKPSFLSQSPAQNWIQSKCLVYTWLIHREFTWNDSLENSLQVINGESLFRDCHPRSRTKMFLLGNWNAKSKQEQETHHLYAASSADSGNPHCTPVSLYDQAMPLITVSPSLAAVITCRWRHPSVALWLSVLPPAVMRINFIIEKN